MKAIVYSRYGAPDVLRLEDIPKPTPGDDEVVLRVCAFTVNPADWHFMRGTPYLVRLMTGLRKPRNSRAKGNATDMATISDLMAAGKVNSVIDRRYGLSEVPDAIRYLEEGHARGKVVITLS